jgi:uncharacterized protein YqeY
MEEDNAGELVTVLERLTEDMKSSMKAGDADRTGVLRLLRGAMKNEEIKVGHPLDEAEALKVLQREAKQRRDSVTAYDAAGRNDLSAHEQVELKIIETYLPQALSEDELGKLVDEAIAETGASDMKQMGQVIGLVMQKVGARAEGGTVSKLVREKLG